MRNSRLTGTRLGAGACGASGGVCVEQRRRAGWRRAAAAALGVWLTWGCGAAALGGTPAEKLAFRVGKVVTMDGKDTVLNDAVLLVADGVIQAVGPASGMTVPEGYRVVEAREQWLVPGLVDCHDHIAGSLGDLNDSVYLTNPGLDSRDTVEPNNDNVKHARTGGVTTVLLIPGSGTNMSGFGTICKMGGDSTDEVVVRSPGSLKIAQAGNPEWYWVGVGRSFMNWNTRQTLEKARDYNAACEAYEKRAATGDAAARPPPFNPIFDNFRGLFRREYPVSVHSQGYQLLMTTLDMLATRLKLWTVLDHSEFDGWKTAPLVQRTDAWTIQGPRSYHFERLSRRMIGNAAAWYKNGVTELGINTDAPVVPQQELTYQATMGCWYGWLPYPALRGVTIVPAKALGLADKLGSIEPGKQADFAIWTGNPIDPRSACLMTVVNGRIVYDASKGRRYF